jgi:hypothetical protein
MTGTGVPDDEMPTIPPPQRRAGSAVTDADLDALLAGTADAASGLRPVADLLAALTAEASTGELAGEARALAGFRHRTGVPVPRRRARRRPARLTSRLGAKAGAALTAVAVVLGGTATAAFANALPAPIQRLAHDAFGAPMPEPSRHLPAHRGRPAHGQGQGSGQGQRGNGQSQPGNGQRPGGGSPHKNGPHGNRYKNGQSGSPHALGARRPAHHVAARGAPGPPGPAPASHEYITTSRPRPTPRVRCGGGAVGRVAGLAIPGPPLSPSGLGGA